MKKLLIAIIVAVFFVCQANAQRQPRATPTPANGSQVQTGTARTPPPNQTIQKTGNTQVNKTNPTATANEGSGGTSKDPNAGGITLIRITVTTGDDDLREGSILSAFVALRNGTVISSKALNCNGYPYTNNCKNSSDAVALDNGTTRIYDWDPRLMPHPNTGAYFPTGRAPLPSEIYKFGLVFESGKTNDFQSPDNWNLDKLTVEYVVPVGSDKSPAGTFLMYSRSGKPLYRFKNHDEWQTEPLSLAK